MGVCVCVCVVGVGGGIGGGGGGGVGKGYLPSVADYRVLNGRSGHRDG